MPGTLGAGGGSDGTTCTHLPHAKRAGRAGVRTLWAEARRTRPRDRAAAQLALRLPLPQELTEIPCSGRLIVEVYRSWATAWPADAATSAMVTSLLIRFISFLNVGPETEYDGSIWRGL